jgi:hypothetical protein
MCTYVCLFEQAKILVADQHLKEIQYGGKIYVVSEYDTAVSYTVWVEDESPFGEVERQYWPFTPFEVLVMFHKPVQPADAFCVTIRIDGVDASQKFVRGNEQSIRFRGFQGALGFDADLKEFCFSPPRPVKKLRSGAHDPNDKIASERLLDLGSVVVTIQKATLTHSQDVVKDSCAVNFADANKKVYISPPSHHRSRKIVAERCFDKQNSLQDCKAAGSTAAAR